MSPRPSRTPWNDWRGIVVICAVLLAGQAVSTWVVTKDQVSEDELVEILGELKTKSRRGSRGRGRGGGEASSAPTQAGAAAGPQDAEASDQAEASDPWSLESGDAVQRWDTLMQERVERLAEKNGVDPTTVLPDQALRELALASGDLRSEPSQQLIAEYSRILRELASE